MHMPNSLYGQPAFVEQFNKEAQAIVISSLDADHLSGLKAAAAATIPKTHGGGGNVKDANKDAKACEEKWITCQ